MTADVSATAAVPSSQSSTDDGLATLAAALLNLDPAARAKLAALLLQPPQ